MEKPLHKISAHQRLAIASALMACVVCGALAIWGKYLSTRASAEQARLFNSRSERLKSALDWQKDHLVVAVSHVGRMAYSDLLTTEESFSSFCHDAEIDCAWIARTNGTTVMGSVDPMLAQAVQNSLNGQSEKLTLGSDPTSFFVQTDRGPVHLAAVQLPSGAQGFAAKVWDQDLTRQIEALTECELLVAHGKSPSRGALPSLMVTDPSGAPLYRLELKPSRDTGGFVGTLASEGPWLALALFIFSFSGLAYLYMRWVSRPLQSISRILKGDRQSDTRGLDGLGPEFRQIADLMNEFHSQSEQLRTTNALLEKHVEERTHELAKAFDEAIEGWSRAMDIRDHETEGHCRRVTDMTMLLASSFEFSPTQMQNIRRGAMLHDIGKIGVPDNILLKPGKLDSAERAVMEQHTVLAYQMLSPITFLRDTLDIPTYHHEKWDGTGYPMGLSGENIPLAARVFAVADVWDALRSDRPYRAAWTEDRVRDYIREQSGTHFDPQVVEAYLSLSFEAVEKVRNANPQGEIIHLHRIQQAA